MSTSHLKELSITLFLRSSETDIKFLTHIVNVILTSLRNGEEKLDMALYEQQITVKENSEKRLSIVISHLALK
jgi:hypothetical protein